ncbi:hypothetical protein Btru_018072 [Bulinus truncatus]|nr:hypothetical protein Btru_018072 [Bulinus truncatus]
MPLNLPQDRGESSMTDPMDKLFDLLLAWVARYASENTLASTSTVNRIVHTCFGASTEKPYERTLPKRFRCRVTADNLSETESMELTEEMSQCPLFLACAFKYLPSDPTDEGSFSDAESLHSAAQFVSSPGLLNPKRA